MLYEKTILSFKILMAYFREVKMTCQYNFRYENDELKFLFSLSYVLFFVQLIQQQLVRRYSVILSVPIVFVKHFKHEMEK